MQIAHLDFETRSPVDIRRSGAYRYAEDPATDIWGFVYRIDTVCDASVVSGRPIEWVFGGPEPQDLFTHVRRGGRVVAHNAAFEYVIWNRVLRRYFPQAPELRVEQLDCTMARSLASGRPRSLDELAVAAHLRVKKDEAGRKLMLKMAKPRRVDEGGTITWWDEPENVDRLMQYCATDVEVEGLADDFLLPLDHVERMTWELDARINDRGVGINLPFAKRAVRATAAVKKRIDKALAELTGGAVTAHGQRARMVRWLEARGYEVPKFDKQHVDSLLARVTTAGDADAEALLILRKAGSKTSTAKFNAMLDCVCRDGRIHGSTVYHGAATGRWTGALVQPQNLARVDHKKDGPGIDFVTNVVTEHPTKDAVVILELVYGLDSIIPMLSKCLRPTLQAADGAILFGADFKNIEGRINAWLAGQRDKVDAFARFDRGAGEDLYIRAYAQAFGVPFEAVGAVERQLGKVQELALGYQGGIGAFMAMVPTYGLDISTLSAPVRANTDADAWTRALARYDAAPRTFDLSAEEFAAADILVRSWRAANPMIKQAWRSAQDAAITAIENPNAEIAAEPQGRVGYTYDGADLWCWLPSGRLLCYAGAEVVNGTFEYVTEDGDLVVAEGKGLRYLGVHKKTKRWSRIATYGGKLWENIVQAAARDVMRDAMLRLDAAGYPIILTVHDEVIAEVPLDSCAGLGLSVDNFASIMQESPGWSDGLPIAVSAWADKRYIK